MEIISTIVTVLAVCFKIVIGLIAAMGLTMLWLEHRKP